MLTGLKNSLKLSGLALELIANGVAFSLLANTFSSSQSKEVAKKRRVALGIKLREFFEKNGPSFIKLGQIFSTRPDLIGEEMADELTNLLDSVPAFPYSEAKKIIEDEIGNGLESIFESFEIKPVAAASIAQVHKAKLKDGTVVAVKILRPNIDKIFSRDVELFEWLTNIFSKISSKSSKRLRIKEVVETLANTVKFELDLRFEAASADKIRENLKNDEFIRVPKIFWEYTSKNVLVMEWVDGIRIDDRNSLILAGHNLEDISKKLAIAFFNQAYRDGFFHADLHPGNIFVDNKGNIVLLDFGIIGILSERDRNFIAKAILSFIKKDYDAVADLHFDLGIVPSHKSRELFSLACRSVGEPIVGLPVNKISIAKLLKQLLKIAAQFEMVTQPQLLLLQKTIFTIEGVGMSIYPEVNMWKLAEPWIKEWARENYSLKKQVKKIGSDAISALKNAPNLINDIHSLSVKLKEFDKESFTLKIQPQKTGGRSKFILAGFFLLGASVATIFSYLLTQF